MKKKFNIKKFTLIELIIVIVVIGVLAGMALPKFIGITKDAKVSAMDQDLDVLEKAVQLYESDNDGAEPFVKDGSGNYAKVSITRQTLKDTLDTIGDDESSVYTLDMDSLKPYLERLKYTDSTTDTYLYSTKTNVAINEQGKIDSSGITHHILNGISSTSTGNTTTTPKITLMHNSSSSFSPFYIDDTTLIGWGSNYYGQLGNGNTIDEETETNITLKSGINFTKISSSYYHSMAIGSDGELYTWGDNNGGQLGNGTTDTKLTPTKIELVSGVKPKQIACGSEYSMAIGSDGNLYTWGRNYCGNLGIGTPDGDTHSIPIKITLPNGVKPIQIACGTFHSMAIGDDGNLYVWGDNSRGQLGDGTSGFGNIKVSPQKITLPNGVKPKQIATGTNFSIMIGNDNELYTWGDDYYGQLGDGKSGDGVMATTPTKIELASGVKPVQISGGLGHSMAIGSDKELYTWGYNNWGQLGTGTSDGDYHSTPTKITLANGVKPTQIACGYRHSMAVGSDNSVYVWGNDILNPQSPPHSEITK